MKSLIFIVGADLVGKSTTAKALEELFKDNHDWRFAHVGPPEKGLPSDINMLSYWKERFKEALHRHRYEEFNENTVIVCDRSPLGNYIYGNRKKDQPTITKDQLADLFRWLSSLFEFVGVNLLRCSEAEFEKRYNGRGEEYARLDELIFIQQEYETLLGELVPLIGKESDKMDFMVHAWNKDTDKVAEDIIKSIE